MPSHLNVVSVSDLHTLHRILYQKSDRLTNGEDGADYKRLLDKIGSYQNKLSFSCLSLGDQSEFSMNILFGGKPHGERWFWREKYLAGKSEN